MSAFHFLALSLLLPPAADALPGPRIAPLFDSIGDPLPEGAIARLGSDRWKINSNNQSIVFSRDGKRCYCAGQQLRIFDNPSGKHVATIQGQIGRQARITPDERFMVTYNPEHNFITRFDLSTRKQVTLSLAGVPGLRVDGQTGQQLSVAADGKQGVALHFRNTNGALRYELFKLRIDSAITATRVGSGATPRVMQLHQSISNDGRFAMVVETVDPGGTGYDLTTTVWDLRSGRSSSVKFHTEGICTNSDFAEDGRSFLLSVQDGLRVFTNPLADGGTGQPRKISERTYNPNTGLPGVGFFATQFVLSGDKLLMGTGNNELEMASYPGLKTVWRRRVGNGSGGVSSLAYTPDRRAVAFTTDAGMCVRFMDLVSGLERDQRGHTESATIVRFHPTLPLLATAAEGNTIRFWKRAGAGFAPVGSLSVLEFEADLHYETRVADFQFTREGKSLTVFDTSSRLLEYDPVTRALRGMRRYQGGNLGWTVLSPDGRWMAAMDMQANGLFLLDGEKSHPPDAPKHEIGFLQYGFSADGKYTALATRAGRFHYVLSETGARVDPAVARPAFTGASRYVSAIEFPENHAEQSIHLWDVRDGGRVCRSLKTVRTFAFSDDARYVVLNCGGKFDGQQLVELASGNVVRFWSVKMHAGEPLTARDICFSPDGKLLAVAEEFGTTLVYDMDPTAAVFQRKAPKDIEEMLRRLRGRDAGRAYAAIGYALLHPKESLSAFRKGFKPAPPPDMREVEKLYAKLGSDRFAVRWDAAGALAALAPLLVDWIDAAMARKPDSDLKNWLGRIRAAPAFPLADQGDLFGVRIVEALERMGEAEAKAFLAEVAKSGDRAGLAARQALERLAAKR